MTDETESLMLDILKAVRGDIARIERKVDEHTVRLGRIEVALAGLHRDVAHHDEGWAEQSAAWSCPDSADYAALLVNE